MALLSRMMRTVAITGRTDSVNAWFAGRQGGRWAEQTISAAFPAADPHVRRIPPAETLRQLNELHRRGVVTDAELERLRARTRV
jgi:hypothetical protein